MLVIRHFIALGTLGSAKKIIKKAAVVFEAGKNNEEKEMNFLDAVAECVGDKLMEKVAHIVDDKHFAMLNK